jgi:hypothetical protein
MMVAAANYQHSFQMGDYVKYVDPKGAALSHYGRLVKWHAPTPWYPNGFWEIDGPIVVGKSGWTWFHGKGNVGLYLMNYVEVEKFYGTEAANAFLNRTPVQWDVGIDSAEPAEPTKHRMGLDPEAVDWEAHRAFLRGD